MIFATSSTTKYKSKLKNKGLGSNFGFNDKTKVIWPRIDSIPLFIAYIVFHV